jgi:hypothetical protein
MFKIGIRLRVTAAGLTSVGLQIERGKGGQAKRRSGAAEFLLELHVSPTLQPEPQPDALEPSRKDTTAECSRALRAVFTRVGALVSTLALL